jgi:CRP/FNR family transcriptional regulator
VLTIVSILITQINLMKKKPSKSQNIHLVQSKQSCEHCDIEHLCISVGIGKQYAHKLNEIVKQSETYERGQIIYNRGSEFKSLYVIQNGVAKSETSNADGRQQVTGFYFPGDLIGTDSLTTNKYPCDLIAVEKTHLCEIPFADLEKLCLVFPELQHELFMRMGQRIYHNEYHSILGRGETAEKRILGFLVELLEKLKGSQYLSGNYIYLPMTKYEISSYLGLQPETFSRSIKQLQQKGYVNNTLKYIEILKFDNIIQVVNNKI